MADVRPKSQGCDIDDSTAQGQGLRGRGFRWGSLSRHRCISPMYGPTEDVRYGRRYQSGSELQRDGPRQRASEVFQPGLRLPRKGTTPESVGAVQKRAYAIQEPQDSERRSLIYQHPSSDQPRWRGPQRDTGYKPRNASANMDLRRRQGSSERYTTTEPHPSSDQPRWRGPQRDTGFKPRNASANMDLRRQQGSSERYTTTEPHPSSDQPRWRGQQRDTGFKPRNASANMDLRRQQGSSERYTTTEAHPSSDQSRRRWPQRDTEFKPRKVPANMDRCRRQGSSERYTTTLPHPTLDQPRSEERKGTKWDMPNVDQQRRQRQR